MSEYRSLSVECRPIAFAEVIGQNFITSVLQRQISTNTFKSAYLFCGPSGCGKTTVARIMARTLNNGVGEPVEVDAASNGNVEFIRSLMADAQQVPLDCDYKIYIIDECHQLSKAAWDSALKLIEEPPMHAIFIFCTTNPGKVPTTILSRCQRFDFKRVSVKDIADRLEFICIERLHLIDYSRDALETIAVLANGQVRDAISYLEKCIDYGAGLSLELVNNVLGYANVGVIIDFINMLWTKDIVNALDYLEKFKSSSGAPVVIFDTILQTVLDYKVYKKTESIECTHITSGFKYKLIKDITDEWLTSLVHTMIKFRRFVDEHNAFIFLNAIIQEMCCEATV